MLARCLKIVLVVELLLYLFLAGLAFIDGPISIGLAAFWILTIAFCLRALPTALLFFLSRRHVDPGAPNVPLSFSQWLRLVTAEWWAITRLYSGFMVFPRHWSSPETDAGNNHLPVLLVHGYVCNEGFWRPLAHVLRKQGWHRLNSLTLEPPFGDMESFVEQLHSVIDDFCRQTGSQQIQVVAHSMGSLVTRRYIQRYGGDRIERLISLGCPHQGTELARWGLGKNACQMEPDSAWFNSLKKAPFLVKTISLYSSHDNVVAPQSRALLPVDPNTHNLPLGAVGHMEMAFSRKVHRLVAEQLL